MNNYFIFSTGMILGAFLGMAALSLLFNQKTLYWHRFRSSVFSALLALDKGEFRHGRDLLHDAIDGAEYE